jgi:hypothetical protein
MKRLSKMLLALALGMGGGAATAGEGILLTGGDAVFILNLPAILPPLIVIQPGVSVVRDVNAEVFYANGYYWSRRDQSWYRAHDHQGSWARVDSRNVPVVIRTAATGTAMETATARDTATATRRDSDFPIACVGGLDVGGSPSRSGPMRPVSPACPRAPTLTYFMPSARSVEEGAQGRRDP